MKFSKIKKLYNQQGYVIIKKFFPQKIITDAKKEIFYISKNLYNSKNNLKYNNKNFDFFILKSLKKNKNFSSKFYDVSKKFLSMQKFVFNKKVINLAQILLQSKEIGVLNRAYGYRMDRPNDKKFLTQLHQDYIQNLGAPEGIVFYTTLRNVNKKNGPVIVYEKSHKLGLLNTKINIREKSKSKSYIIDITKDKLKSLKEKQVFLNERDLAVFNFFLLHKSSENFSKNIRWSMVSRFFNFNSKIGIKNFFPDGIQNKGFFENYHPNKISK